MDQIVPFLKHKLDVLMEDNFRIVVPTEVMAQIVLSRSQAAPMVDSCHTAVQMEGKDLIVLYQLLQNQLQPEEPQLPPGVRQLDRRPPLLVEQQQLPVE